MPVTLISSYHESNKNTYYPVYANGKKKVGQSFSNPEEIELDSAKFYLVKGAGSPTGDVVAKVYAHTGEFGVDGVPIGDFLAISDVVDASTFGSYPNFALILFHFSGAERITLSGDTDYFVILEHSGGDTLNYMVIGTDSTSPTDSGNLAYWTNGPWLADARDCIYYIYGGSDAPVIISANQGHIF